MLRLADDQLRGDQYKEKEPREAPVISIGYVCPALQKIVPVFPWWSS